MNEDRKKLLKEYDKSGFLVESLDHYFYGKDSLLTNAYGNRITNKKENEIDYKIGLLLFDSDLYINGTILNEEEKLEDRDIEFIIDLDNSINNIIESEQAIFH